MSVPALSQMTIADQNVLIIKLLEALVNPMSVEPGTARQRVSIEAIAANLTLTTLTSLTQLAGFDAKLTLLNATELGLWSTAIRSRIS